jgi:hypothetical protein
MMVGSKEDNPDWILAYISIENAALLLRYFQQQRCVSQYVH